MYVCYYQKKILKKNAMLKIELTNLFCYTMYHIYYILRLYMIFL